MVQFISTAWLAHYAGWIAVAFTAILTVQGVLHSIFPVTREWKRVVFGIVAVILGCSAGGFAIWQQKAADEDSAKLQDKIVTLGSQLTALQNDSTSIALALGINTQKSAKDILSAAGSRILDLQSQVDRLVGRFERQNDLRKLTEDQITKLRANLAPLAPKIHLIYTYSATDRDSEIYAIGFYNLLSDLKFNPQANLTLAGPDDTGVMVGTGDPDHPSDIAKQFKSALNASGLNARFVKWEGAIKVGEVDFDLFIGPRP